MQKDVVEQIRRKEEETDEAVRKASAAEGERLRHLASDNELRIRTAAEKNADMLKGRIARAEEAAAETEKAALEKARREADAIREQAEKKMPEAVALIVQTVLRQA